MAEVQVTETELLVTVNETAVAVEVTEVVGEVVTVNEAGPQGPRGLSAYQVAVADGFVGTVADWLASIVGDDGADGATIRVGVGIPDDSLGSDGDLYLRTNGDIYHKAAGVYTAQFNIIGADGAPGSVLRNGDGAPDNGVGIDGDYWLNDLNGDLYEKVAGAYGVVANITGPVGPGAEITASNGLTRDVDDIKLGGTLAGATTIDLASYLLGFINGNVRFNSEQVSQVTEVDDGTTFMLHNYSEYGGVYIDVKRAHGTEAAPTTVANGDNLFSWTLRSRAPSSWASNYPEWYFYVDGVPSGSSVPVRGQLLWSNGTVAIDIAPSGDVTFGGLIAADNFSGSSSGTNTGDQDLSDLMTEADGDGRYVQLGAITLAAILSRGN